jgi:uncharacterized protein YbjT (DUF2867 family)
MRLLLWLGYLVAALVLLVVAYVFVLSGSFHTPVNALTPAPYRSPGGPIIVFGGTRATGLEIVRDLRARGEDVVVAVRPTSDTAELQQLGARTVIANALNADEVNAAMTSGPYAAVISTLGTSRGDQANRPDYVGNRNVFDAAKAAGVRRVVFITVIGAGESRDAAPLPARRALAEIIDLKTRAEDHLKASGLDYTIIRPGGLSDRGATGQAYLAEDPEAFSYISRRDLAQLAVAALGDPATIGKAYSAYDPERRTLWKMFND